MVKAYVHHLLTGEECWFACWHIDSPQSFPILQEKVSQSGLKESNRPALLVSQKREFPLWGDLLSAQSICEPVIRL